MFLDPAKKGLRYPNLKSKSSLHLQLKFTVISTSSVSSIYSAAGQYCWSSAQLWSCSSAHHQCCSLSSHHTAPITDYQSLLFNAVGHRFARQHLNPLSNSINCCKSSLSSTAHCHQPVVQVCAHEDLLYLLPKHHCILIYRFSAIHCSCISAGHSLGSSYQTTGQFLLLILISAHLL